MAAQELYWDPQFAKFMDHCDKFSPADISFLFAKIMVYVYPGDLKFLTEEYDRLGELPSITLVSSPAVWDVLRWRSVRGAGRWEYK